MYKNILQSIDNIEIWPVISFIIFFIFFLGLLWWTLTADNNFINTMKNIPLDDSTSGEALSTKANDL